MSVHLSPGRVLKPCEQCGTPFVADACDLAKGQDKYCSYACYSLARRARFRERFWSKVDKNGPVPEYRPDLGPCWIWIPYKPEQRYGRFWMNGRNYTAQQAAYIIAVGPIPEGLHIDHLCRNQGCVNPSHLEAVTCRENMLRGNAPVAIAVRTNQCKNGHPLSGDNLYIGSKGERVCRTCKKQHYWNDIERSREYNRLKAQRYRDAKRDAVVEKMPGITEQDQVNWRPRIESATP